MSSRKRSSFPTDNTNGNDIVNRSKKSKQFPSSHEAMTFNTNFPQRLESDRKVNPPSVATASTSCQDRNTCRYDLDLMVSKDTEQLNCCEGNMSNSSGNNMLRVKTSLDNLSHLRQNDKSQVSQEDEKYEDIKARKTSQRSNRVSSVATLSPIGIMKIQNEGRDVDPSYRAIPFYFTPPPLFTMNCTNFGASNFSQFHQKLYPSVFTNLESNKELSSLKEKKAELRNKKFEGNGIDLNSNYSELSQAMNLDLLKDHHHQREAENWQKHFISHQEHSIVANSLDLTRIMSHQDLYQIFSSQTSAFNDTENLLYRKGYDDKNLSQYQCQIRKLMEYFEAGEEDVKATIQGRNKPIVLKQVGIRCYFCSKRAPQHRTRGSTYYPTTLQGLYQACQNLASVHLCQNCPLIPESLSHQLMKLRASKSLIGGGKHYWAESAKSKGIEESHGILIISSNHTQTTS